MAIASRGRQCDVKVTGWLQAGRAPFLPASLMSLALGTAVACRLGLAIDLGALGLAGVGVGASHLGINMLNDYFDAPGTDRINRYRNRYSGGSGMIQAGRLTMAAMGRGGVAALALALLCGILLATRHGPAVLLLAAAGGGLGVAYSAPPLRLVGSGWGEFVAGMACGPLVACGGALLQGGREAATAALWPALPVGLLVAAILIVNELPDYPADLAAGKRNLVVRYGPAAGARLHGGAVGTAMLFVLFGAAMGWLPAASGTVLLTVPLAIGAVRRSRMDAHHPVALSAASAATAKLHMVVSAILVLSYLL